jgi:hypothetical protein
VKNSAASAGASETAYPTIDSNQLALVAQAVSPADVDFSQLLSLPKNI